MYCSSKSDVKLCDKFEGVTRWAAFTQVVRSLTCTDWCPASQSPPGIKPSCVCLCVYLHHCPPVHAPMCPSPPLPCLSQVQNSLSQTLQDPARREGRTHSVYCTTTKKLYMQAVSLWTSRHTCLCWAQWTSDSCFPEMLEVTSWSVEGQQPLQTRTQMFSAGTHSSAVMSDK